MRVKVEELLAQSVSVPSCRRALEPCLRQDIAHLLGSSLQESLEVWLGAFVARIHEDLQRSNAATCI